MATLAGAPPATAARLAASMLALQVSIGAVNDLADAPRDAAGKPGKPLPAGDATRGAALALAVIGLGGGLALSAPSGPVVVLVAATGVGLGYLYDLRLSGTALSWLPLALALPLLPIHAWLGAGASLPPSLLGLVPLAIAAGAGLALANGLVDLERDALAGRDGLAGRLGRERAWVTHAVLLGLVAVLALVFAPGAAGAPTDVLRLVRVAGLVLGAAMVALGAALLADARPARRERGWELEAIGTAAMGIGWLAGTAAAV